MRKKRFNRVVSVSLIICIYTLIFSNFLPAPDKKEKMGVSVVVVKASDAVVTEVISDVLLELLASLGVSATGYVLGKTNQADKAQEAYEKYVAENTNGVTFVVGSVAYNITHPGVSKTISNTLVQQVQDAINNSPEAREEFEKLIQAVMSGAQITGSMLKNLWLMLTKGAIDDYNASISNHDTTVYQDEWDIFKYENWSEEMKDIYNSGYKSYVFFSYMGQMEIALFPIDFHPPGAVDDGEFPLTIKNISEKTYFGVNWTDEADCYIFRFLNPLDDKYSEYFPNSILTGWEYANGIQNNFYGISDYVGNSYDDNYNFLGHYYGYQFNSIIWWQDTVGDMIFGIPDDDIDIPSDDSEPCVLNPNKVITDMPEKIVNDEPIEIPDGTTIDDVVGNPALPGEIVGGIPVNDVVTGVLGEFVPVQDIDFPWEDTVNPDIPADPSVPANPELDTDDYKIKPAVIDKFPFCVPWDIIKCFSLLGQDSEVPKFKYRFYIKSLKIDETIVIDLKDFEPVAEVSRFFFRIIFIFGLVLITRNQIRG